MSRNIRDLREIINISRLSNHGVDTFQCDFLSDEDSDETPSLDGYIASRPSSALGTRSSFKILSSASLNNNNNNDKEKPVNNSSYSQHVSRPLTVPIGSHHKKQQVAKQSDTSVISHPAAHFPSHYKPVPPIGHKEGGKQRNKTLRNPARRNGRRGNFDEVLSYLDSVIVNEWLEECNKAIDRLNIFAMNYKMAVGFFNFLLDEMKFEEYCRLLDMNTLLYWIS